jgi:hypothetical protein
MPWKPGQSGNPHGRPPKPRLLSQEQHNLLAEIIPLGEKHAGRTRAYALVFKDYELAMSGDQDSMERIWNRHEGKVPDQVLTEHSELFAIEPEFVTREEAIARFRDRVAERNFERVPGGICGDNESGQVDSGQAPYIPQ